MASEASIWQPLPQSNAWAMPSQCPAAQHSRCKNTSSLLTLVNGPPWWVPAPSEQGGRSLPAVDHILKQALNLTTCWPVIQRQIQNYYLVIKKLKLGQDNTFCPDCTQRRFLYICNGLLFPICAILALKMVSLNVILSLLCAWFMGLRL